jgi:RNA polymerase sigma-70 factor (ECF subfamily)
MMDTSRTALRALLVENYEKLAGQLARRLRSRELAHEALQDTYLRLESGQNLGVISRPLAYLLRMATNAARDRKRAEIRFATSAEIETALEVVDETPDPARAAEASSEIAALELALSDLPARRRAIFLAAWRDNLSHRVIAQRHGLSVRTIDIELELAREYCAASLKRTRKK